MEDSFKVKVLADLEPSELEFLVEEFAEMSCAMALETESRKLDKDVVLRGVRRLMSTPSFGFYVVALSSSDSRRVLGMLGVTFEWSDWRDSAFWWIQSVYVKPEARRRGVFRKMYQLVDDLSRQGDAACGLRLYVEKDNSVAKSTYSALGMSVTDYRIMEVDRVLHNSE